MLFLSPKLAAQARPHALQQAVHCRQTAAGARRNSTPAMSMHQHRASNAVNTKKLNQVLKWMTTQASLSAM